ncbi:MAG: hypothetical protein HYX61_03495 [Gammaproteobacteria bacterium]|nr:hypothetical protein [Gammaproteobacteria bacterium]
MNYTIFYAKLIGLYMLIMSVGMFINSKNFRILIVESATNTSLNMFAGVISLLFGLTIVLTHPLWQGWPMIITIIGYLAVLKGIVRVCFTNSVASMVHQFRSIKIYYFISVLCLLLGIILLYYGYRFSI